ncbi:hypothetical protein TA3x_001868 [Tundrisphaera sp. TA3]|uniref:hypothetical protein n=1 Tax=Tundrisphaera sp. TA3 TaxID=3435775 RepID=UPI003EBEC125
MTPKPFRLALIPAVALPPFLGLALLSGCGGDDGTHRQVPLTEENKANIAAENAASEQAAAKKTTKGQP